MRALFLHPAAGAGSSASFVLSVLDPQNISRLWQACLGPPAQIFFLVRYRIEVACCRLGRCAASQPLSATVTWVGGDASVVISVVVRRLGASYRREALLRAGLDRLDPKRFEELAAELLRRDGFRKVRVVGGSGDRGIDVLGVAPDGSP